MKQFAKPPISNFFVSAAGFGSSGNVYVGVNIEIPKNALNQV